MRASRIGLTERPHGIGRCADQNLTLGGRRCSAIDVNRVTLPGGYSVGRSRCRRCGDQYGLSTRRVPAVLTFSPMATVLCGHASDDARGQSRAGWLVDGTQWDGASACASARTGSLRPASAGRAGEPFHRICELYGLAADVREATTRLPGSWRPGLSRGGSRRRSGEPPQATASPPLTSRFAGGGE